MEDKSQHFTNTTQTMSSFLALNSCSINSGISRSKKAYQGGVKKLYLFPYRKLNRSAIYTVDNYLESFPITDIYEFDVVNKTYRESSSKDAAGVYWKQDLSFDVPISTPSVELHKLTEKDYRAIVLDNLGNYFIVGLYNGLEASVTKETGTDKANLNGYRVSLSGKEDYQAYYLADLSLFRLQEVENYLFEDGCNYIFEDGQNYIFN